MNARAARPTKRVVRCPSCRALLEIRLVGGNPDVSPVGAEFGCAECGAHLLLAEHGTAVLA